MRRARRVRESEDSWRAAAVVVVPTFASLLGHNGNTMIGFLVLLFPVLLLIFMLVMERIEEPLTRVALERDVEDFLEHANPDELNTLVWEGPVTAMSRFRARLRVLRLSRRR